MTGLLEPTDAMIEAGIAEWRALLSGEVYEYRPILTRIYLAMRSSAPQEPDDDALVGRLRSYRLVYHGNANGLMNEAADAIERRQAKAQEPDDDDDALLKAQNNVAQFLSAFDRFSDDRPVCYGLAMGDLRKLLAMSRLQAKAPETGA